MTTISTEISLHTALLADDERLQRGDLHALLQDRAAAQWVAQRLVRHARERWPGRHWTVTDLLDLLWTAVHGPRSNQPRVLEARHIRRHLRERCHLAERYGEPLGVVVLHLLPERAATRYASALDRLLHAVRPEDTIVLFRRHIVFLLPRAPAATLPALTERLMSTTLATMEPNAVSDAEWYCYDPSCGDAQLQELLDWVEDRLR